MPAIPTMSGAVLEAISQVLGDTSDDETWAVVGERRGPLLADLHWPTTTPSDAARLVAEIEAAISAIAAKRAKK